MNVRIGEHRGGSRTAPSSKMERFVILVNGCKPLTVITKRFILVVAAVLGPPLEHIGILPLTKKQVKPKNNPVADHYYFIAIQHPLTILVF